MQLLDINFPPKITKPTGQTPPVKKQSNPIMEAEIVTVDSVKEAEIEVRSCSSKSQVSDGQNGYNNEGETTMYSAETAESRTYPSPKEGRFGQQPVGRSQSCVNYNRWGPIQPSSVARGRSLEKQRSYMQSRKVYSQGATSHRSNEYYSPTVSSIMKKRNNLEQQWPNRSRRATAVHSSPKWAF